MTPILLFLLATLTAQAATVLLIAGCVSPAGQTNTKPALKPIHRESLDRNRTPFYSPSFGSRLRPR